MPAPTDNRRRADTDAEVKDDGVEDARDADVRLGRWLWAVHMGFYSIIVSAQVWRLYHLARYRDVDAPGYDDHTRRWEYYHSMDPSLYAGPLLAVGFFFLGLKCAGSRRPRAAFADGVAFFGCIIWSFDTFMTQALGFT